MSDLYSALHELLSAQREIAAVASDAGATATEHALAKDRLTTAMKDGEVTLQQASLSNIPRGELFGRCGDMTPAGESVLYALLQSDGDVCLSIYNHKDDEYTTADVEFCALGAGGGRSPRTVAALRALVAAIAADNAESPRVAWPQRERSKQG